MQILIFPTYFYQLKKWGKVWNHFHFSEDVKKYPEFYSFEREEIFETNLKIDDRIIEIPIYSRTVW